MKKLRQSLKLDLVDPNTRPVSDDEIQSLYQQLNIIHRNYVNYIAAILVLACGVAYRVMSMDFEMGVELFEVSINIGLWLGMFTGFMVNGDRRTRIKICTVSILVSASSSVFAAMITVLLLGYMDSWIMSVNILASALGSMWVLTYYDEVNQARIALKYIDDKQLAFFNKAAEHFEELESFRLKIKHHGRRPLMGEYWAILEWIHIRANSGDN